MSHPTRERRSRRAAALAAADIKCGVRSDSIRFSTHVYNDIDDATRAAAAIAPFQR